MKLETRTTIHWKWGKSRSYKCEVTATYFDELLTTKGDYCQEIVPGKPQARQHVRKFEKSFRIARTYRTELKLPQNFRRLTQNTLFHLPCPPDLQSKNAEETKRESWWRGENSQFLWQTLWATWKFQDFCLFDSDSNGPESVILFRENVMVAALSMYRTRI